MKGLVMTILMLPNPVNKMLFFFFSPYLELPQDKIKKLGQELFSLERLMEELGNCIGKQKDQLKHLKVK